MSVNLCVGGEAITSVVLSGDVQQYGPHKAFDGNTETLYASESFVGSILPYVGYKFSSPVSIGEIYLYQATFRYCPYVYVRYSDDGENWEDAELFGGLTVESTLTLSKNYGEHLYWCVRAMCNPVGEQDVYPWCVGEIKMYGYSASGDNNENTDNDNTENGDSNNNDTGNDNNNNTEDNESTEDNNTGNETEKTNTMSEVIKNSVKNTILNNELIRHCITYENET